MKKYIVVSALILIAFFAIFLIGAYRRASKSLALFHTIDNGIGGRLPVVGKIRDQLTDGVDFFMYKKHADMNYHVISSSSDFRYDTPITFVYTARANECSHLYLVFFDLTDDYDTAYGASIL